MTNDIKNGGKNMKKKYSEKEIRRLLERFMSGETTI